eukprot:m.355546 g.355546  ORF g.355546 m.355546 type:complete len:257 (-) comp17276_c0_seq1:209-979(-)
MSAIGTGYDLSVQTFSPAGRVFQVEYAGKAVDNAGTVVAMRGTDGVVFACDNAVTSKLFEPNTTRRTHSVGKHIGSAFCGLIPDGRALVSEARSSAVKYRDLYGHPIPLKKLNDELSSYMHMLTLYGGARPCGCSIVLGSYNDKDGAELYMGEPSGVAWGYYGCALGKNKQAAQSDIEKFKPATKTCREIVKEAVHILKSIHDDTKQQPYELEVSWVCQESNGEFASIPADLLAEAEREAEARMADSDSESDEDSD